MILALTTLALALPQSLEVQQLGNGLRFRVDEIPSASHVCVLWGLRTQDQQDPLASRGLIEIYAAGLQALLHSSPDRQASMRIQGTTLLVLQTVPVAAVVEVLRGIRARLAGPLPLGRDGFALARARARLQADDATQVFPGPILKDRAGRLLGSGEFHATALPEEIHRQDLAGLLAWQSQRISAGRSFVFLLGGISDPEGQVLIREHFADLRVTPRANAVPAAVATRELPLPPLHSSHRQVLAPFVSLAVPAPPSQSPDRLAFAVGMAVLRQHAAFEFGAYRAGEARAGFPFLDYDFARQDGVALLNRRGIDGDQTAEVVAEIRGLYQRTLEHGFSPGQVQRAARSLAVRLRLPPYSLTTQQDMGRLWRMLFTKALVLAGYEVWGWPRDLCQRLESVQVEDVNRVLREQMSEENSRWLSLEPIMRREQSIFGR